MNESRFIELLNLYVDHQLSASEAAELEGEISRNPERRSTYLQYCRMQKACTLLFEQERIQAPESKKLAASLRDADRKIISFPEEQIRPRRGYYPVGLFAAAACAAFVFARFTPSTQQKSQSVTAPAMAQVHEASTPDAAQPVTIPAVAPVSAPNSRSGLYTVFASPSASAVRGSTVSDRSDEESATLPVSYSWMRDVQLTPVQSLSSSRITLKAGSVASSEDRVLRSRKPVKDDSEMSAAYQFQR